MLFFKFWIHSIRMFGWKMEILAKKREIAIQKNCEAWILIKLQYVVHISVEGAGGHILWLGEVQRSSLAFLSIAVLGRPCFSSSDRFLFCWADFLSISLLASVFLFSLPLFSSSSYLAWFIFECLTGVGLLCMDTDSYIHGVCRWH